MTNNGEKDNYEENKFTGSFIHQPAKTEIEESILANANDPNQIDVTFFDYTEDLQYVLDELSELRFPSPPAHQKAILQQKNTLEKDHIQLNSIQLFYRFLIWLQSVATAFVSPIPEDQTTYSWQSRSKRAQTAGNIFFLNIIRVINQAKRILNSFSNIYKTDPSVIGVYFSFIGISTDIQLIFLLIMASFTSNFTSFVTGLLFLGLSSVAILLCIPLIVMLISLMLFTSLSISATNVVANRTYSTINNYIPTRSILTYFADQIPPSVGRVEVTHQKQRKDNAENSKAQTSGAIGN